MSGLHWCMAGIDKFLSHRGDLLLRPAPALFNEGKGCMSFIQVKELNIIS